jgi:hypothetical protein
MTVGDRFISRCPVGCEAELREAAVLLPDDCLLSCSSCGYLVSQIGDFRYETALSQSNSWQGALPVRSVQRRHDQRATGKNL